MIAEDKYGQTKIGAELNLGAMRIRDILREYIKEFPDRKRVMTRDELDIFKAWLGRRILKRYNLEYLLKEV